MTSSPISHSSYEHVKSSEICTEQNCSMTKKWFSYSPGVISVCCVGETERKQSLIIIHSPSNPSFLFARTYLLSCGWVSIETVQARHGSSNSSSLCLLSGGNWLWNFSTHPPNNTKIIKTIQGQSLWSSSAQVSNEGLNNTWLACSNSSVQHVRGDLLQLTMAFSSEQSLEWGKILIFLHGITLSPPSPSTEGLVGAEQHKALAQGWRNLAPNTNICCRILSWIIKLNDPFNLDQRFLGYNLLPLPPNKIQTTAHKIQTQTQTILYWHTTYLWKWNSSCSSLQA